MAQGELLDEAVRKQLVDFLGGRGVHPPAKAKANGVNPKTLAPHPLMDE